MSRWPPIRQPLARRLCKTRRRFDAQTGGKHPDARVLKGFGGASVLEVVANDDGDTYRVVYTVKFSGVVYVLHAFQKKSKRGIKTPHEEIEKIGMVQDRVTGGVACSGQGGWPLSLRTGYPVRQGLCQGGGMSLIVREKFLQGVPGGGC